MTLRVLAMCKKTVNQEDQLCKYNKTKNTKSWVIIDISCQCYCGRLLLNFNINFTLIMFVLMLFSCRLSDNSYFCVYALLSLQTIH